jgi:hypothetical protein
VFQGVRCPYVICELVNLCDVSLNNLFETSKAYHREATNYAHLMSCYTSGCDGISGMSFSQTRTQGQECPFFAGFCWFLSFSHAREDTSARVGQKCKNPAAGWGFLAFFSPNNLNLRIAFFHSPSCLGFACSLLHALNICS